MLREKDHRFRRRSSSPLVAPQLARDERIECVSKVTQWTLYEYVEGVYEEEKVRLADAEALELHTCVEQRAHKPELLELARIGARDRAARDVPMRSGMSGRAPVREAEHMQRSALVEVHHGGRERVQVDGWPIGKGENVHWALRRQRRRRRRSC